MIKISDIKVGSVIRFDGACEEYSRKEYSGFLNCDLQVTAVKFYHQGVIHLKLVKFDGEGISLPLDINTASKWFSPIEKEEKAQ